MGTTVDSLEIQLQAQAGKANNKEHLEGVRRLL